MCVQLSAIRQAPRGIKQESVGIVQKVSSPSADVEVQKRLRGAQTAANEKVKIAKEEIALKVLAQKADEDDKKAKLLEDIRERMSRF